MNGVSTLTQKGQVAIPKAIRDYFNLKAFDKLSFEIQDGKIIANPVPSLIKMRGIVRGTKSLSKQSAKALIKKSVLEKFQNKNKSA